MRVLQIEGQEFVNWESNMVPGSSVRYVHWPDCYSHFKVTAPINHEILSPGAKRWVFPPEQPGTAIETCKLWLEALLSSCHIHRGDYICLAQDGMQRTGRSADSLRPWMSLGAGSTGTASGPRKLPQPPEVPPAPPVTAATSLWGVWGFKVLRL